MIYPQDEASGRSSRTLLILIHVDLVEISVYNEFVLFNLWRYNVPNELGYQAARLDRPKDITCTTQWYHAAAKSPKGITLVGR
jgi:hypothetical protein